MRSSQGSAASPRRRVAMKRRESSLDEESDGNFLGTYFREMSDLDVMTPEQELEAATRIARMRRDYWRSLLAYPPFIDGVAAVIEAKLEIESVPDDALGELRRAARALRDRETKAHQQAFDAAVLALAEAMSERDVDGIVSDILLADLSTLETGARHGLTMEVTPPRHGSKPFSDYVKRARSASIALRMAKNDFVKANLRLVVSIARRFNHGRMPLQDLIQEGNIGLLKAVDRFDHRRGFRFSTYGSWWIRHAISRAIADKGRAVRLPVHMIDANQKISRVRREFEARFGREPTPEEIATQTGIAVDKIERMGTALLDQAISLDRSVSDDDDRRVVDFLEDEHSEQPGESLEASALNQEVRQILGALRPIEADILRKRFGLQTDEEATLKEIGSQYSLSRERIRQLQEQALGKIRRELKRREIMP
jgi:RNA polymerase primary sigma factor